MFNGENNRPVSLETLFTADLARLSLLLLLLLLLLLTFAECITMFINWPRSNAIAEQASPILSLCSVSRPTSCCCFYQRFKKK
jgi:hypothetical protein